GGLMFSVGAPSVAAPVLPAAVSDLSVRIALWAARFLVIAGLVFGVGGVAFGALVGRASRPPGERFLAAALLTGILAAVVLWPVRALAVRGEPLAALSDPEVWRAGLWSTSYGRATLLAAVALLLGYGALHGGALPSLRTALGAAALVVAGAAFAAAGHAAS